MYAELSYRRSDFAIGQDSLTLKARVPDWHTGSQWLSLADTTTAAVDLAASEACAPLSPALGLRRIRLKHQAARLQACATRAEAHASSMSEPISVSKMSFIRALPLPLDVTLVRAS
jgi:hypothetical protein